MQQQNERSVSAEVPVDEDEGQLHEHGRHEGEEEREPLPDLVSRGAVRGAEVESCRGLGREQRHRHKYRTGESHPHSRSHLENPHVHTTQHSLSRWTCRPPPQLIRGLREAGRQGGCFPSQPGVVTAIDCRGRHRRCASVCTMSSREAPLNEKVNTVQTDNTQQG